jgi:hypothetical protein
LNLRKFGNVNNSETSIAKKFESASSIQFKNYDLQASSSSNFDFNTIKSGEKKLQSNSEIFPSKIDTKFNAILPVINSFAKTSVSSNVANNNNKHLRQHLRLKQFVFLPNSLASNISAVKQKSILSKDRPG